MKECICGCGADVVSKMPNADFAAHHPKKERIKLRRQWAKLSACAGMLPPHEWRLCDVCGQWFPMFKEIYGKSSSKTACPAFISDNCWKKTRVQAKSASMAANTGSAPEDDKEFRTKICIRDRKLCRRQPECSERAFAADPKDRLWEYEIHGKDCYKSPGYISGKLQGSSLGSSCSVGVSLSDMA